MEELDDDFGDLYADVELQVDSSIKEADVSENYDDVVLDSDSKNVDEGSDSEDDLNIVLNDDDGDDCGVNLRNGGGLEGCDGDGEDDQGQVVGDEVEERGDAEKLNGVRGYSYSKHSQYKYIRPHAAICPNNKSNGSLGMASSSSMMSRGDWNDRLCNHNPSSSQFATASVPTIQVLAQSGYGFSLPRYRSILDVDIDTFEQKPWKRPGVDITDYFNFGFDEKSWKNYCYSLEQFRQKEQEDAAEQIAQVEQRRRDQSNEMPKGRAIQVEGSILERRPSMDVKRPRNRDSDVVIQIAVQDTEDFSGSGKEEVGNTDISTLHEKSEHENFCMDDKIEVSDSASIEEHSRESKEMTVRRSDTPVLKRCSKLISNVVRRHHQKVNVPFPEENADAVKMEALDDQTQESLGLSCSRSHSGASEDQLHTVSEKTKDPSRRLRESVTSNYNLTRDSKRNDINTKARGRKYSAKNRSPARRERKHDSRRHQDHGPICSPSNREGLYYRDHSAFERSRWKERLNDFDSCDIENFSPYRERFEEDTRAAYTRTPQKKDHFRDEIDPYIRRKRVEREYFHESDWYDSERGHSADNINHIYKESRCLDSKYSSFRGRGRDTRWRRETGELDFRNRTDRDDFWLEHEYTDEHRYVPFDEYGRDSVDERYGMHLPYTGRELEYSWDDTWHTEHDDEYWKQSNQKPRRPYIANDLRTSGGKICNKRVRDDDWFDDYNDAYYAEESTIYHDHGVDTDRRFNRQSEVLDWAEDEFSGHHDDEMYAKEIAFSCERASRHERIHAKHGSDHRRKMVREGSKSNSHTQKSKHEQIALRCRDSVDLHLAVGERKSVGSKVESIPSNSRHENIAQKVDKEHMNAKDYNGSHNTEKVVEADISKNISSRSSKKLLDKHPVPVRNEALDMEEGQILIEDTGEKKHALESKSQPTNMRKKPVQNGNASDIHKLDNKRLLETIAKMEKRRERFKEPIALKKEPDPKTNSNPNANLDPNPNLNLNPKPNPNPNPSPNSNTVPEVDPIVGTGESKQQRPARKRRWGGS